MHPSSRDSHVDRWWLLPRRSLPFLAMAGWSDRPDRWGVARSLLLACLCSTGCALTLQGPAEHRPRNKPPECDTGKGLVTLDTITGVGLSVLALGLASSNNDGGPAAVSALVAASFFGSAIHGNNNVNECRKAMLDYGSEAPIEAPPPPLPVQPMTPIAIAPISQRPPVVAPAATPPPPPPPPPQDSSPWSEFWKEAP